MQNAPRALAIITCVTFALCGGAWAQESTDQASKLAKAAQNPLAAMTTLPLQFNWNTGAGEYDRTAFNLNVQPVNPFQGKKWNVIARAIMPIVSEPQYAITHRRGSRLPPVFGGSWLDWRVRPGHAETPRPRCSRRRASLWQPTAPPVTVRETLAPHPCTASSRLTATRSRGSGRGGMGGGTDSGGGLSMSRLGGTSTAVCSSSSTSATTGRSRHSTTRAGCPTTWRW